MLETFAGPGASAQSEMARVLAMKPMFIVKKQHQGHLRKKAQARRMLDNELAEHYVQVAKIDGRYIFRQRTVD